jgi:hypothetical protein
MGASPTAGIPFHHRLMPIIPPHNGTAIADRGQDVTHAKAAADTSHANDRDYCVTITKTSYRHTLL